MGGFGFMEWLILILVGLLFFKEQLMTFIGAKMGIKTMSTHKELGERMDQLVGHFNHETTEILTELRESQKRMCMKIGKVEEHLEQIRIEGVRIRK